MLAIFKRELRSYFTSPMGYIFCAVFLIVNNLFFYLMNILRRFSNLKITTIARGIGFGDELEYVDELTITHALLNRREVK